LPVATSGDKSSRSSRTCARHALRPIWLRAVIQVESGFQPAGRDPPRGAMGLMQFDAQNRRELGVRNPYDPSRHPWRVHVPAHR